MGFPHRWLKFEEKVEDGDRWSKPHVPTPSLHSLLEMRRRLAGNGGLVTLDLEVNHGCMQQLGGGWVVWSMWDG